MTMSGVGYFYCNLLHLGRPYSQILRLALKNLDKLWSGLFCLSARDEEKKLYKIVTRVTLR
jgi:hypothetical protein